MQTTAGSLALVGTRVAGDAPLVANLRERGRRDPGQDEPERVGELPRLPATGLHFRHELPERLERPRRVHARPVSARLRSVRIELWLRRRAGGQHVRRGSWQRDRWIHRVPGRQQRDRRPQANDRAHQPGRNHPDRPQPGLRRTDDANGDRRRDHAERHALAVRTGGWPAAASRLHGLPQPELSRGCASGSSAASSCRSTSHCRRSTPSRREGDRGMADAGAEIVDPVDTGDTFAWFDAEFTVLLYEFKGDIAAYLSGLSFTARHAHADACRPHRLQQRALRGGDEVLRPGDLRDQRGAVRRSDRCRYVAARSVPGPHADPGHRSRDGRAQP